MDRNLLHHLTVRIFFALTLLTSLAACAGTGKEAEATLVPTLALPTPTASFTPGAAPTQEPAVATKTPPTSSNPGATGGAAVPMATETPEASPTPAAPTPTFDPDSWMEMPVIPTLSPRALEILRTGLEMGHNPRAFSKIGDCESQTDWFLDHYDQGPEHYALGPYAKELQPVVDYYQGSFNRNSLAARQGFTAASLMAPIWSDRQLCEPNETPLGCEFRIHRPLVAFILVGTNDATNPPTFEKHMRKAIEFTISQGVLPVLGTKADNVEGDHAINATMARLAYEYQVPLWNYWAAVQTLPGEGLQEDRAHLTFAAPYFDNPTTLERAWPVRNLNALQVLSEIMEVIDPS